MSFLLLSSLACGPRGPKVRLEVRPDYAARPVMEAFDSRYDPPESRGKRTVVIQENGAEFRTIAQAIAKAPDGSTLLISEGVFHESIVLSGRKSLALVGAGRDRTLVVAPEAALLVNRSKVSIAGIGFWSHTDGPYVSVAIVSASTLRLSDCRLSGGTGVGLLLSGNESRLTLVGNLILGNLGGGVRLKGGALESVRNVVALNALGGIILTPAEPGSVGPLSFWHDSIVGNYAEREPRSFTSGEAPVGKLAGDCRIEASVLDAGGLAETFSPEFVESAGTLDNLLLSGESAGAGFFRSAGKGNFAPAAALPQDELELEVGAYPYATSPLELAARQEAAVASEKLQLAYLLSLFLPLQTRAKADLELKNLLYKWTEQYLQDQRLGLRSVQALGLIRFAPPEWHADQILDPIVKGCIDRHTFALQPLNFIVERFGLADTVRKFLLARTSLFPRFVVATDSPTQNAYVLSGKVRSTIMASENAQRFSVANKLENPFRTKLSADIEMTESKIEAVDAKIEELNATLSNPMGKGVDTEHRDRLTEKMETLKLERGTFEYKLKQLRKQGETVKPSFDVVVEGIVRKFEVKGELAVQFVAAPSGDILLDEILPVSTAFNEAEVFANPEFGLKARSLSGLKPDPVTEVGNRVAELMLEAVIAREIETLQELLGRFEAATLTAEEDDRLAELVLMNAHLYEAALSVQEEYKRLLAEKAAALDPVNVAVSYDEQKGQDSQAVTIEVSWNDQISRERRLNQIERIYRRYWELQEPLDRYIEKRLGMGRKRLFETREILNRSISR